MYRRIDWKAAVSMATDRRISARQHAVLHIVEAHGPVTPVEVHRHCFTASAGAARASLTRLEAHKLVEAEYTASGGRGRAYVITERGIAALAAFDASEAS